MGTNYYYHPGPACTHCGQVPGDIEWRHIGKSSRGWCFSLHVYPEDGIAGLDNWRDLFAVTGCVIRNEYREVIKPAMMLEIITERDGCKEPTAEWCERNHATPGPRNLARHRIKDTHCLSHGEGTWDCMVGEYS